MSDTSIPENKVKLFFNQLEYLKNSSDRIIVRSNMVRKFLGPQKNISILDIGCGDGSLSLPYLSETNQLTLVDISDKMIERVAGKIPNQLLSKVRLVNDSFEAIDSQERFDVVLCVGVIAHVPDVNALFNKINTVLKPGGFLVLETTPNPYPIGKLLLPYYYLRSLIIKEPEKYNKNRLKVAEVKSYAKKLHLQEIQCVRYSFPLPGMSHWPQVLKLKYTLFTLNSPFVSRFGSEHLFLFKKSN